MDNSFDTPVILSLCPGVLGLERGLERAIGPVTVAAYVEIEAFIIANLVAAMEKGKLAPAPIWSDIKTLNGAIFRNKINGIIGGYPCQPFSNAGARNGTSDPRHLYPFISGIIEAARPVWCFFENVEGHLTLGYPEVSADLRSMGYAVEAGIYSAEEVGAPHQRNRLFILAIKSEYVAHLQVTRKRGLSECKQRQEWSEQGNSYDTIRRCEKLAYSGLLRSQINEERTARTKQCSGSVVNTNTNIGNERNVCGKPEQIQSQVTHAPNSSREMGYPASPRRQGPGPGPGILRELQEEAGIRIHDRPEQPGLAGEEYLADSSRERCERSEFHGASIEGQQQQESLGSTSECSRTMWPARPGEEQYEWERPRTKSRLGSTIDGYNFREDLLRAYGNSVVEQTAEIAFIDLLNKHIANGTTNGASQRS